MPGEERQFAQAFLGRLAGKIEPPFGMADILIGILQNREIQRILIAKVVINHALVGSGAARDHIHPAPASPFRDTSRRAASRIAARVRSGFRTCETARRVLGFSSFCTAAEPSFTVSAIIQIPLDMGRFRCSHVTR